MLFSMQARRLHARGDLDNTVQLKCRHGRVFLAATAIIRGEASFLVEWIEFHTLVGFEHFIFYDNGFEPETEDVLRPYVDAGLATRIPWPDVAGLRDSARDIHRLRLQELAYGDCVSRYADRMDWLAIFDIDEFIYPISRQHERVSDALRTLERDKWLGVRVPVRQFGSSGHIKRPRGLVLANYIKCERALSRGTKSIGNTRMIARNRWVDPHRFRYRPAKVVRGWLTGSPRSLGRHAAAELLIINHYRLKSREDYQRKTEVNAGGWMTGKQTTDRFEQIDATHSDAENRDILRFLGPLERRVRLHEAGAGSSESQSMTDAR